MLESPCEMQKNKCRLIWKVTADTVTVVMMGAMSSDDSAEKNEKKND